MCSRSACLPASGRALDLLEIHHGKGYRAGHRPGRGVRRFTTCCARRTRLGVPGREPGADEHAAAPAAAQVLRSGDGGGDRAARPDPRRHGSSLSQAAQAGGRAGNAGFHLPGPSSEKVGRDELSSILGRTFGVPIFQGTGDEDRHGGGGVHSGRGQPAAQGDGHLPLPRGRCAHEERRWSGG